MIKGDRTPRACSLYSGVFLYITEIKSLAKAEGDVVRRCGGRDRDHSIPRGDGLGIPSKNSPRGFRLFFQ